MLDGFCVKTVRRTVEAEVSSCSRAVFHIHVGENTLKLHLFKESLQCADKPDNAANQDHEVSISQK